MKKQIEHVSKFHDVFQIGNEEVPKAVVAEDVYMLRYRLMNEENEEYLEACKEGDLVEIADALGDQLYILCGTILKHGLQDSIVFGSLCNAKLTSAEAKTDALNPFKIFMSLLMTINMSYPSM